MLRFRHWSIFGKLRRFAQDTRGMAAVEFAVIASVLTTALLGGTELARYALLHQKIDRVSSSVSNWVAQSATMSTTDFENMWAAAKEVAKPFDIDGASGRVIISFIVAETDTNYRITWQRTGAGTMSQSSTIGAQGGWANLPSNVALKQGDTIVAVEVYALYEAFVFSGVIGSSVVYHRSFDTPRLVDLITLE